MYNVPTADFVTTSLSGVLAAGATSGTIGTGLNLPATNGLLSVSYDTANAVGVTDGPETFSYTSYTSGTGAIAGLVRGLAGTTDVQHSSGQSVQSAFSSLHLGDAAKISQATAWTDWVPTYSASESMTFGTITTTQARSIQLGKLVFFTISFIGTTAGPVSYGIDFTLPVTAKSAISQGGGCAVKDGGGYMSGSWSLTDTTHCEIRTTTGANFGIGANRGTTMNGFYEAA